MTNKQCRYQNIENIKIDEDYLPNEYKQYQNF